MWRMDASYRLFQICSTSQSDVPTVGWYLYLGSIEGEGVDVDFGGDMCFSRLLPLRGAACLLVLTHESASWD